MIGVTQIGHKCEEGGEGTVRIGSKEVDDMIGSMCDDLSDVDVYCPFSKAAAFCAANCLADGGSEGRMGGGSSMFSAAFLDSWRAKSEACHHSRNLSAKILVGNRIFSELNSRGCTVRARFLGENIEPPSPGRAGPTFLGAVRSSMAAWSA